MNTRLLVALSFVLPLAAQDPGVFGVALQQGALAAKPFDVAGRVVTWDGQPIAGARVAVATMTAPTVAELLRAEGPVTAADGTFTLHVPVPETKDEARGVLIAAKGFASRWQPLYVQAPGVGKKPIALGDIVLPPGQRMVGRVRDGSGAVADALVVVQDLLPQTMGADEAGLLVCSARTSQGGVFDLPCALAAGTTLRVEADGYFTAVREPVAAGTPLEFELQKSGHIVGQVQDQGGQAAARARLFVSYETDSGVQTERADAQGMFRIPLRHAGRWRIRAAADGERSGNGESSLGEGPATGLTIVFEGKPEAAAAAKKLQVRAVTKGTGAAARSVRAVAMWGQPVNQPKAWLRQVLANQLRASKPGADGTAEVPGPSEDGQVGVVYVAAEGHAPCLQVDVAWDEKNPSVAIELTPEASVRGVVRDAATKQPIAGVMVMATNVNDNGSGWQPFRAVAPESENESDGQVRTAADGTFRIGELDEGDWQIVVVAEGRPPAPPQTVTLKSGEARGDVVVEMPLGARVAGKLVGAAVAAGCRVALEPVPIAANNNGAYGQSFVFSDFSSEPYGAQTQVGKPLAADASFEFTGQALGHYTLMLRMPAPPRSGAALFLPVDSFRLRANGVQRDFDIAGDRVCTVRGKVSQSGASTPFENLVAVAEPLMMGGWWHGGGYVAVGTRAFVARDGAFTLPVLRGSYHVAVVDLALGVTIARSKLVEVGDTDVECNVEAALTKVTIELKPAGDAKMAAVERIELRCALASQDAGMLQTGDDSDSGRGIRVAPGTTSLTLALPASEVCLFARSNTARLRQPETGEPGPALGKLEFAVPGDNKPVRVLEIGPPPEIVDEKKGEKDEKGKDR